MKRDTIPASAIAPARCSLPGTADVLVGIRPQGTSPGTADVPVGNRPQATSPGTADVLVGIRPKAGIKTPPADMPRLAPPRGKTSTEATRP